MTICFLSPVVVTTMLGSVLMLESSWNGNREWNYTEPGVMMLTSLAFWPPGTLQVSRIVSGVSRYPAGVMNSVRGKQVPCRRHE